MKYFKSDMSGKEYPVNQRIPLYSVRASVIDLIKKDYPSIDETSSVAIEELDLYRQKYIEKSLKEEFKDLTSLEEDVLDKLKKHELVSANVDRDWNKRITFGQKIADKVASFGGSWRFIIIFLLFILCWIALNVYSIFFKSFDPYPFILLNLLLSCLAALQAPVIMMSQNRVEEKDRERAKEDYKINLKSELEIQMLHEKIDHLILTQQQKLFEIQNIQVQMLEEIISNLSVKDKKK